MPRGRRSIFPPDAQPNAEERARALVAADVRLVRAKERISIAALACLRGSLDAAQLVRAALDEVARVRALLAKVGNMDAEA